MTPRYFLGVDVGGTKSHALIADEQGHALGFAVAGSGNHEVVGYDGTVRTLEEIVQGALDDAGIARAAIAGAGFGIGGYDWPSERADTLDAIGALSLNCPVEAVNDTIIGLVAGAEEGWGVALVAGTSNNCRGWDRNHREGRVMGNGTEFGENGGAYELVNKAVHEVGKAWTRRGPATALTDLFVAHVGARDDADLLEGLSQYTYNIQANAAPLVFKAAEAGDAVAQEVIRWTAEELASLAIGVIHQLELERERFDVVLVGSLYNGGPLFTEPLFAAIRAVAPGASFVRLSAPPVVGAVLIGMQIAGLDTHAVRAQLIASSQTIMERVAA
jgi:N-acetylglucosamine kinase-like BadF-type ATPase